MDTENDLTPLVKENSEENFTFIHSKLPLELKLHISASLYPLLFLHNPYFIFLYAIISYSSLLISFLPSLLSLPSLSNSLLFPSSLSPLLDLPLPLFSPLFFLPLSPTPYSCFPLRIEYCLQFRHQNTNSERETPPDQS